jgi:hypothetical protein
MSIYAWRYWFYREPLSIDFYREPLSIDFYTDVSDIKLYGAMGNRWPIGKALKAECTRYMHSSHADKPVPVVTCTCGIYALKKPHKHNQFDDCNVTGIVEIWGKIIKARYGYRAQFGQIRAVVNAPEFISRAYGIPNLPSIRYAKREYFR